MKTILFILLVTMNSPSFAFSKEEWNCTTYQSTKVIVKATHEKGEKFVSGTISVAGGTHKTIYSIQGFNRRWAFNYEKKTDSFNYLFIIEPDGSGLYYDFTQKNEVSPSLQLDCKKI